MADWQLRTPVAFIIFNRPDTTERVFAEIAKARPPKLLVVADGPRANRPGESEKCAVTRDIIKRVDWDCEVLTNFSDVNLGCKRRVSSGIDWVFEQVPEAIILEDDCLPHPSFFRFCEEMLERYRHDTRIMAVSGDNFQFGQKRGTYSYYFSRYNHVWGWASWRRAWQHYDVNMRAWPAIRDDRWLAGVLDDARQCDYWTNVFERVHGGLIDTWDYQWTFACWIQNGLTVLPQTNLISNIGFGVDATHTQSASVFAELPVHEMGFPLQHPPYMLRDAVADGFTNKNNFSEPPIWRRVEKKLRKLIGG